MAGKNEDEKAAVGFSLAKVPDAMKRTIAQRGIAWICVGWMNDDGGSVYNMRERVTVIQITAEDR